MQRGKNACVRCKAIAKRVHEESTQEGVYVCGYLALLSSTSCFRLLRTQSMSSVRRVSSPRRFSISASRPCVLSLSTAELMPLPLSMRVVRKGTERAREEQDVPPLDLVLGLLLYQPNALQHVCNVINATP